MATVLTYDEEYNSENISDETLLQAFGGERTDWAAEHLYRRYQKYLYSLAYRILRDSYLAEDVIQEVFVTLWHKASEYRQELGSLKSWLQVIVRNRALDKVRSAMYREYQFAPLDYIDGQGLVSYEPEMWQSVWGAERAQYLQRVLRELPSEQREALELNFFAGYTHAEIARRLALPVGTVKGRIRLGLARVRARLQAEGIELQV